jgi:hypothetical protein
MKAGIADPEKTSTATQGHVKHFSMETNNRATTEELLEAMFSTLSVPRLCKENQLSIQSVENVKKLPSWIRYETIARR